MLAPSVSYQISSLLWTRVSFEQSRCCSPHRLQGVRQLSEAGSAAMGSLSRLLRLRPARDWSSSAIFPFNCPMVPSACFWSPSGFSISWRLLPPFPLLGRGGRGEAGAKRLLKKWFPVFCLQSAGGGGGEEQGWGVFLFAWRGVARIFNSAVIRPHCL